MGHSTSIQSRLSATASSTDLMIQGDVIPNLWRRSNLPFMPSAQHFPPALSSLEMTPDSGESHEMCDDNYN
jgi:hypothetical protein